MLNSSLSSKAVLSLIAIEDHEFGPMGWLSASFGVAAYRSDEGRAVLFKRADLALYRAKERGKNRVEADLAS